MPGKRSLTRPKFKWSYESYRKLLECRDKAKELVGSDNHPRNESGRKMGYMKIMHNLFLEQFPDLNYMTPQNLRDKISHAEHVNTLEKSQTSLIETFNSEVNIIPEITVNSVNVGNHGDINYVCMPLNMKECEAFNLAKEILLDVYPIKGEMANREWKTRTMIVPKSCDVLSVNKIVNYLQADSRVESQLNSGNYFDALWNLNCIAYSAIIGWYRINNVKCVSTQRTGNNNKSKKVAAWEKNINNEVLETRRLISQCVAEIERLKVNGRITRKTKRNRKLFESKIGSISVYSLTKLVMRLKARLRRLSNRRRKKLKNEERRHYNNTFSRRQGQVYDEFKHIIKDQPDVEYPIFKKGTVVRKYFENTEEVLNFWKSLWEKDDPGNPNASWLNNYKLLFEKIIPNIDIGDIQITDVDIWNSIKKKRNWSAPGPDMLVNFWLKKMFVIYDKIRLIFSGIINTTSVIETWYARGRTSLLEKDENFVYDNTRPITCTNNIYKWFSSVLLDVFNQHMNKHNLMQMDQRGAKSRVSGTFQNILIDDMVLKDAHDNRRNLACAWVDVRKAFDSLSHKWVKMMLEIHRFPAKLTATICNVMSAWNIQLSIPVAEGEILSDPIFIKNGVLQGDVICPNLYTLSKNPISWELRRFKGYTLSKPLAEKVTHLLFIDDLRVYDKSRNEQRKTLSHAKRLMSDAGLEWNTKKCKVLNLKRGVVDNSEGDLELEDGSKVESLKTEDVYKFLGILENEMHDIERLVDNIKTTIVKRASVVWSSPLSDYNKVQATNIFVISCLEYFMWTEKFNLTDLREIDMSIRNVMNMQNAKYKLQANSSLYLPRSKGGRGLKQVEYTYKMTRIKAAMKILTDVDPEMRAVKRFDKSRIEKKRSSVIGDAIAYSRDDFNAELICMESGFDLRYGDLENRQSTSDIGAASNALKNIMIKNIQDELCSLTWQGATLKERISDEKLITKNCFEWCEKWKDCPVEVINDIQSIYLQTIPTLCFKKFRGEPHIVSTICRLCHKGIENVEHLLSWCGFFLPFYFMRRHNRALQYICFLFLSRNGLIDKCPPWYSDTKIKPEYENEEICLHWDIPENLGKDDDDDDGEERSKDLRPDGRLNLKKKKQLYILEMSVPWITHRETKYLEKEDKYKDLIISMKGLYPEYKIGQITLIMDCLGGYSQSLIDNLKIMGFTKVERTKILTNMQKIVLSESRFIINRFKQRISI